MNWWLTCGKVAMNYELFFILLVLHHLQLKFGQGSSDDVDCNQACKVCKQCDLFFFKTKASYEILFAIVILINEPSWLILFACNFFQLNQEIVKNVFGAPIDIRKKMNQVQAHIDRFRDLINKKQRNCLTSSGTFCDFPVP